MKTTYMLTLKQEDVSEPIGKLILVENDIYLIIKGINKIESAGGDYYQTYATNISVYGDPKYPTDGTYKDTVRWANMSWYIDELEILGY